MVEIIKIIVLFPRFVDDDTMEELNIPISMGELEAILKWFRKDKSLGFDGSPVEFYLTFLDLFH
ncbi:hypothetical protein, partial [Actinobacillus pleuropneumoniae]|uniref:hypothetical protein n=1 Tax=Actinobacillus pleuropneumoniae TaxID=715 RepID=UPI00227B383A